MKKACTIANEAILRPTSGVRCKVLRYVLVLHVILEMVLSHYFRGTLRATLFYHGSNTKCALYLIFEKNNFFYNRVEH